MKDYRLTEGNSAMLDFIRGISAQFVVIGHGMSFFGIFGLLHIPVVPWIQNTGVLIFFLLSGFLITYSTVHKRMNNEQYSFKYYFIDRFSRIYTAFVPALCFVACVDLFSMFLQNTSYGYHDAFNLKAFAGNLLMMQDYPLFSRLPGEFMTSFGSARPFWSLAIEWWIYLLFGYLVLVFCKQKKITVSNIMILAFFSIVPVFNLVAGRGDGLTVYWLFGSLIYLVSSLEILSKLGRNKKIVLAIIVLALAGVRLVYKLNVYDAVFAFLLATLLFLLTDIFRDTKFSKRSIRLIHFNASYSYTLYLVHYTILDFIHTHLNGKANPFLLFAGAFVISNIVSYVIGYFSEMRLTKKVKSFLYAKAGAVK